MFGFRNGDAFGKPNCGLGFVFGFWFRVINTGYVPTRVLIGQYGKSIEFKIYNDADLAIAYYLEANTGSVPMQNQVNLEGVPVKQV